MNESQTASGPFPSIAALRAVHNDLLKAVRDTRSLPGNMQQVNDFIARGVATGTLLASEDDRNTAQSLLDYWSAMIYRLGTEPPDTTLADFDQLAVPELSDDQCPYPGLAPFYEEQQDRFFGRRRLVDFLLGRLKDQRFLALLGPIGSGKSSVLRAGLIPALKSGGLEGSAEWRYLKPITPSTDPLSQLAKILPAEPGRTIRLQAAPQLLAEAIASGDNTPVVLLVDQFEELFTLTEDEQIQEAFVAALVNLADMPGPRHTVLLGMRSDLESSIARFPALQSWFERGRIQLMPPGPSELRDAIERPAELVGLKFESGLVDRLIEDLLGEPAALPLLQFTLLELWERRDRNRITWAAYNEVGAGRQALARVAEAFYGALVPDEQRMARRLLLRLVRLERGLDVATRRVRRDALLEGVEPRALAERVMARLEDERLVRVTRGDTRPEDQIELAHEALARNWSKLVDWVELERAALEVRRRLETRAAEWVERGRGAAGLLDAVQLAEAETWLESAEAQSLGYDDALPGLVAASRAAIEEAQQRELLNERALTAQAKVLAEEQRLRAEEASARQRAEEQARRGAEQRAEEQARGKRRLGWALISLGGMFMVLLVMAGYALQQANAARVQEASARRESQTRVAQAIVLQTAQLEAENSAADARNERATAVAAQATADGERIAADNARATAEAARIDAERRQRQARAGELSALALAFQDQPQIALLLAAESLNVSLRGGDEPAKVAIETLRSLLTVFTGQGYYAHSDSVTSVAFSGDGQLIATGGLDGRVLLWDPADPRTTPTALDAGAPIEQIAWSADSRFLITVGELGDTIRLWDTGAGGSGSQLTVPGAISDIAISANSDRLVIAGDAGTVRVWSLGAGGPARDLRAASPARAVAVSPDGRWALTGHADGIARLWDLNRADPISPLFTSDRRPALTRVAFSPNGRWVVIGDASGLTHLWGFGNGFASGPFVLRGQTAAVTAIAISPDNSLIATGSDDGTTYLWRIATRVDPAPRSVLRGHSDAVTSLLITPDSKRLVTASADRTIGLWSLDADDPGATQRVLLGHDDAVLDIALSPDGELLASGGVDRSLRIWELNRPVPDEASLPSEPAALIALACQTTGRTLSEQEWQDLEINAPYQQICPPS